MNKLVLAAAAAAAMASFTTQAAPTTGLVGGLVGTGTATLSAPLPTLTKIITGRSAYAGNLAPFGLKVSRTIVPVLTAKKGAIPSETENASLPLPGPAFLNMDLIHVPGRVQVSVTGANPYTVTYTSGK